MCKRLSVIETTVVAAVCGQCVGVIYIWGGLVGLLNDLQTWCVLLFGVELSLEEAKIFKGEPTELELHRRASELAVVYGRSASFGQAAGTQKGWRNLVQQESSRLPRPR